MNYKVIRFVFEGGVHLGQGRLSDSSPFLLADTLFSALCFEAITESGDPEFLIGKARSMNIRISDAFPYIGDTLYLPKPFISIRKEDEGDSVKKKAFKKLKYVPADKLDIFLKGDLAVEEEVKKMDTLGTYELRTNVVLDRTGESTPYHVGVYHFNKSNGLYCILAYETEEDYEYMMSLFRSLGYSGIGGRKSSGLGRFTIEELSCPSELLKRMNLEDYSSFTSLSFSLPKEEELGNVMDDGNCQFLKRSGFVASGDYSDEFRKKKDLYGIAAGSITKIKYKGDIYDVSEGGKHPVYRYAFPMFLGVE